MGAKTAHQDHTLANGTVRFGFSGSKGSYSHAAAREVYANMRSEKVVEYQGYQVPAATVAALLKGQVDWIVVPIQNQHTGPVGESLAVIQEPQLVFLGSHIMDVDLRVFGKHKHMDPREVRYVLSHPDALAQCRGRLLKLFPNAELEEVTDTATAAQLVREGKHDGKSVAICSGEAGELHKLHYVLDLGLGENHTEFHVYGRRADKKRDLGHVLRMTLAYAAMSKAKNIILAIALNVVIVFVLFMVDHEDLLQYRSLAVMAIATAVGFLFSPRFKDLVIANMINGFWRYHVQYDAATANDPDGDMAVTRVVRVFRKKNAFWIMGLKAHRIGKPYIDKELIVHFDTDSDSGTALFEYATERGSQPTTGVMLLNWTVTGPGEKATELRGRFWSTTHNDHGEIRPVRIEEKEYEAIKSATTLQSFLGR